MQIRTKLIFAVSGPALLFALESLACHLLFLPWYVLPILAVLQAPPAAWLLIRSVMRPVTELNQNISLILAGKYDCGTGLDTGDEIGSISRGIDVLAKNLQGAQQSIEDMNEEADAYHQIGRKSRTLENRYERLFENSTHAVFIHSSDGTIREVNGRAVDLLGYSRNELVRMSFWDLNTEEEWTRSKKAFADGPGAQSLRFESVLKMKDGGKRNVDLSMTVVDQEKDIFQSIAVDITEKKQVEEALRASEAKFRNFMETANDIMFITDEAGRFVYVNPLMVRQTGFSMDALYGMDLNDLCDREYHGDHPWTVGELTAHEGRLHEIVWKSRHGDEIYAEMKVAGVYDAEGHCHGMRGIVRDVSERKKIEKSQRLAQLGRLSANMAHEVKNQIQIISALAGISLMDGVSEEEKTQNARDIENQCQEINDLVRRLMQFARPGQEDFTSLNIHAPLESVTALIEKKMHKENVQIIRRYSDDLPQVRANDKQLQEVFMNILGNAAEAMESAGEITIHTRRQGDLIRIDFMDNGSGMPADVVQRIFDPFFTTKEEGTGLGLSVCYGIIRNHGGELLYESAPGKGTTATVLLPAA